MTQAIVNPHRPDEQVRKAMTMLAVGYSSQRVSDATGIPSATIRQWSRSPEITAKYSEATKAARERLAYRTSQIFDRELDKIEEGTVEVSPLQAATMWGHRDRQGTEGRHPIQEWKYEAIPRHEPLRSGG